MLNWRTFTASTLLLVTSISYIALSHPRPYQLTNEVGDRNALISKFSHEISSFGDQRAYVRFAEALGSVDIGYQHEYAHLFGDALYKQEGLKAISVCDTRFEYGCFHQVISDALIDHGISSLGQLSKQCAAILKSDTSCLHGTGHGILISIVHKRGEYDQAHLEEALGYCHSLSNKESLVDCDGGVYMEYNTRVAYNAEFNTAGVRQPDMADLKAPCDNLQQSWQPTCYFWLPQWWVLTGAFPHSQYDLNQKYTNVGSMCASLSSEQRRACFGGVGYAAPPKHEL